jgi:hypothetical protein
MVSRSRRKGRAYLYKQVKCIGCGGEKGRGRGAPSHQEVWLPRFQWCLEMSRDWMFPHGPRVDCYEHASRHWWNTVNSVFYHEKLYVSSDIPIVSAQRAEKSRHTRRRKRGLRRGRRRSRECHSRRSAPPPARVTKVPCARKVNHQGRKFLWAMRASESLRADCKKYAKFPVGPLPEGHPARLPRKKMKEHCRVKWIRLHRQAEVAGIPPVAAFHSTFWKYLAVETSRGRADWDGLLAGLPGNPATDFKEFGAGGLFARLAEKTENRKKPVFRGSSRGARNNPRGPGSSGIRRG